jgi:hypothetical protein
MFLREWTEDQYPRHHRKLKKHNWQAEALKGNYFLRGFNYLFIMKKEAKS